MAWITGWPHFEILVVDTWYQIIRYFKHVPLSGDSVPECRNPSLTQRHNPDMWGAFNSAAYTHVTIKWEAQEEGAEEETVGFHVLQGGDKWLVGRRQVVSREETSG